MTRERLDRLAGLLTEIGRAGAVMRGAAERAAGELSSFLAETEAPTMKNGDPMGVEPLLGGGPSEMAELPAYFAALKPEQVLRCFVGLIVDCGFDDAGGWKSGRTALAAALCAARERIRGHDVKVEVVVGDGAPSGLAGASPAVARQPRPAGPAADPSREYELELRSAAGSPGRDGRHLRVDSAALRERARRLCAPGSMIRENVVFDRAGSKAKAAAIVAGWGGEFERFKRRVGRCDVWMLGRKVAGQGGEVRAGGVGAGDAPTQRRAGAGAAA